MDLFLASPNVAVIVVFYGTVSTAVVGTVVDPDPDLVCEILRLEKSIAF